jgi:hypothetical protein
LKQEIAKDHYQDETEIENENAKNSKSLKFYGIVYPPLSL